MIYINYKKFYVLFLCSTANSMLAMDSAEEWFVKKIEDESVNGKNIKPIETFEKSRIEEKNNIKRPYSSRVKFFEANKVFEAMSIMGSKECKLCGNTSLRSWDLRVHYALHFSKDDREKFTEKKGQRYLLNLEGKKRLNMAQRLRVEDYFQAHKKIFDILKEYVLECKDDMKCPLGVCNLKKKTNFRSHVMAKHLKPISGQEYIEKKYSSYVFNERGKKIFETYCNTGILEIELKNKEEKLIEEKKVTEEESAHSTIDKFFAPYEYAVYKENDEFDSMIKTVFNNQNSDDNKEFVNSLFK